MDIYTSFFCGFARKANGIVVVDIVGVVVIVVDEVLI